MTVTLSNLRTDTTSIFSDFGETLFIFRKTGSVGAGGHKTYSWAVVTQSSVNTITGMVQPKQHESEIGAGGMKILLTHQIFLPYNTDIAEGDVIVWTTFGDTGTGTGASGSLTDSTKSWITNQWVEWWLIDKNIADFVIDANTTTALTVSGTPTTGTYYIGQKLIVNSIEQLECHKLVHCKTGD